jgi:NAD(P)-dependent dehydrogenase (short-subunit alcohol dehydrogenase family)
MTAPISSGGPSSAAEPNEPAGLVEPALPAGLVEPALPAGLVEPALPAGLVEPALPAEALGTAPGRGRLTGRRVLVVGAGTRPSDEPDPPPGNGRAIAILAAREGAAVVCADRNPDAAAETVARIEAEGGRAVALTADVTDAEQCSGLVAGSVEALGGLDGVVLNVGIALGRGLTGTSAKDWDVTFAVNVRAHFLIAAAALPVLAPRSAIVFVSSSASLRAGTGAPSYDSSKAALLGLARQTAREAARNRSRANVLVPGYVDTPMGRAASAANPNRARRLPLGRQATPWEVAYGAVFLLSNESSYMTGQSLILDGGTTGLP